MLFSKLGPAFPATPHTRKLPLREHPSTAPLRAVDHTLPFHVTKANEFFHLSAEPEIAALNDAHAHEKGSAVTAGDETAEASPTPRFGGGGLFWGGWYTLKDEEDKMTLPMYAILGDVLLGRDDHDASRGLLEKYADFSLYIDGVKGTNASKAGIRRLPSPLNSCRRFRQPLLDALLAHSTLVHSSSTRRTSVTTLRLSCGLRLATWATQNLRSATNCLDKAIH